MREFWYNCLYKIISLFLSLKVWILSLSTGLFLYNKLDASDWKDIVISIAVARVVIEGIGQVKGRKVEALHR